jgi:hypothetical protein
VTNEELIRQALAQLSQLPQDEVAILEEHFGVHDRADLALRIARDARDMWSPAEESGVRLEDWVSEFIAVTVDLFQDQRRVFEMQRLREIAAAHVDSLPARIRALVCCLLRTNRRERVASLAAEITLKGIKTGLTDGADLERAVERVLEVHLASYVDHVDAVYFQGIER